MYADIAWKKTGVYIMYDRLAAHLSVTQPCSRIRERTRLGMRLQGIPGDFPFLS